MSLTLQELLGSAPITRLVSRIKTPKSRFQNFFGMNPGGTNNSPRDARTIGYDIYDKTRDMAKGRPPATGPGTRAPFRIEGATVTMYRSHEKLSMADEKLRNLRALGEPFGTVDPRAVRYVASQARNMSQTFKNSREFVVSRMLRGGYDIQISGDDMKLRDIGDGNITVDFKIPSSNKTQLNMDGSGSIIGTTWANTSADIAGDLAQINAAFEYQHGMALEHAWINSTGLMNIMNNTGMKGLAGTANRVFESWLRDGINNDDGSTGTGFTVRFNAVPWLIWHVYDAGLNIDINGTQTFTKFIPDTVAIFHPSIDSEVCEMMEGSEIVRENWSDQGSNRYGFTAWTTPTIDPAGYDMKCLDNFVPGLYIPKAFCYGTVVY